MWKDLRATSAVLATLVACASAPRPEPHVGLERVWGQFLQMPKQRALAIAGDPDGVWVGGLVGGHPSQIEVEREALEQCNRRRIAKGLSEECRLYAVGHRIVWEESGPEAPE